MLSKHPDLDVCIAARNEEWLARTLDDLFQHAELDTRAIVTLDGYWPDPPLIDHPKVTLIHHTESVGQRAGYNEAVQLSRARFIAKFDAHTSFDQGFDRKLIEPYDKGELAATDITVPVMGNLHCFDWVCDQCGKHSYQGPTPEACGYFDVIKEDGKPDRKVFKEGSGCGPNTPHHREVVWQRRRGTNNSLWWFDKDLHVWYCRGKEHSAAWNQWNYRASLQGDFVETMACMGNGWLMPRGLHHAIGGLDEATGSWGQVGVEVGCKAWLSGGRLVTNKRTWFAHLFRSSKDFSFPYPISGSAQDRAKVYSREMWRNNRWVGQKRPLRWLIEHFSPVPTWSPEEIAALPMGQFSAPFPIQKAA